MRPEKTLSNFAEELAKEHIPKQYIPLTEVGFYILMALSQERHGYEIIRWTRTITDGELELQGGTLYNSLARMERDGLISITREDHRRKFYQTTLLGKKVLQLELMRLARIYKNSLGKIWKRKPGLKQT